MKKAVVVVIFMMFATLTQAGLTDDLKKANLTLIVEFANEANASSDSVGEAAVLIDRAEERSASAS